MKLSEAQALLFGSNRANLGPSLNALARGLDARFGSGGVFDAISAGKVLGSMASYGFEINFSAGPGPKAGGQQFKLSYRQRGNTLDDTIYDGNFPDILKMIDNLCSGSSSVETASDFTFNVGGRRVSIVASHAIAFYEGTGILDAAEIRYSSSGVSAVGGAEDQGMRPFAVPEQEQYLQIADGMPKLSMSTTRPFAGSFALAVSNLAPHVNLVSSKSEV